MSTTIEGDHRYFNEQCILHLRVPAGTPALFLGDSVMYAHHKELVLGRGRIWMPTHVERELLEPSDSLDPDSVLHIYGYVLPEGISG